MSHFFEIQFVQFPADKEVCENVAKLNMLPLIVQKLSALSNIQLEVITS